MAPSSSGTEYLIDEGKTRTATTQPPVFRRFVTGYSDFRPARSVRREVKCFSSASAKTMAWSAARENLP